MPAIKLFNFTGGGDIEKFCFKLSIITFLNINAFAATQANTTTIEISIFQNIILMITNFMIKPILLIKNSKV